MRDHGIHGIHGFQLKCPPRVWQMHATLERAIQSEWM
jgi:hypothetical protein